MFLKAIFLRKRLLEVLTTFFVCIIMHNFQWTVIWTSQILIPMGHGQLRNVSHDDRKVFWMSQDKAFKPMENLLAVKQGRTGIMLWDCESFCYTSKNRWNNVENYHQILNFTIDEQLKVEVLIFNRTVCQYVKTFSSVIFD